MFSRAARTRAAQAAALEREAQFTREGIPIHIGPPPPSIMDAPSRAIVLSSRQRVAIERVPAWRRILFYGLAALANVSSKIHKAPPTSRV